MVVVVVVVNSRWKQKMGDFFCSNVCVFKLQSGEEEAEYSRVSQAVRFYRTGDWDKPSSFSPYQAVCSSPGSGRLVVLLLLLLVVVVVVARVVLNNKLYRWLSQTTSLATSSSSPSRGTLWTDESRRRKGKERRLRVRRESKKSTWRVKGREDAAAFRSRRLAVLEA